PQPWVRRVDPHCLAGCADRQSLPLRVEHRTVPRLKDISQTRTEHAPPLSGRFCFAVPLERLLPVRLGRDNPRTPRSPDAERLRVPLAHRVGVAVLALGSDLRAASDMIECISWND